MVRAVWRAAKTKTGGAKRGRAQFGIGGVEHNQFGDRGCTGDTSDATEPYDRGRRRTVARTAEVVESLQGDESEKPLLRSAAEQRVESVQRVGSVVVRVFVCTKGGDYGSNECTVL
ncbi:hypothetical protein GN958_ATG17792 [Phytophthora infestans]|uniref:Uncharacterized protein n=1 Tax=Phytophthora infestans TaxID=4787 RepID=A0A8S9TW96_PHYIN|nr:hypothetical protein GN958_ATG17792 [Phytophthora infestans]